MDKSCTCKKFDGKEDYFSKVERIFEVIAASKPIKNSATLNTKQTTILKCITCNSYYIWDSYKGEHYANDKISARKYYPKTDDYGLIKILRSIDGIINEKDLNEYSELYEITKNAVQNMGKNKKRPDENQN
jgi:hypothetical protein